MLILTRKVGESIKIGDNIVVHVTGVAGGKVKLGIEAPQDVHILRSELSNGEAQDSRERGAS